MIFLQSLIWFYRFVSPGLRLIFGVQGQCVHVPSCSVYMEQSLAERGMFYGTALGIKRILNCHPWK